VCQNRVVKRSLHWLCPLGIIFISVFTKLSTVFVVWTANLLTMETLHGMDHSQLIDLLAKLTSDYTKMITDNNMSDDYEKCKLTIKAIQTEIDTRKNNMNNDSGEISMTTLPDFS